MLSVREALAPLKDGMQPAQVSLEDFACSLNKYQRERALPRAVGLHDTYICQTGLQAQIELATEMVEVGSTCHAAQVCDRPLRPNDCEWSRLIIDYAKRGDLPQALILYQKIQGDSSLCASGSVFVALLNACTTLKDLEKGHELHAAIARSGLLERDVFVGSALVDMYGKCGSSLKAQEVFDKLPVRDVATWTALIAVYANRGQGLEALNLMEKMRQEGVSLNSFTFVCSLKACGNTGALGKGKELHGEITKKGLEQQLLIGNILIDMYARCGLVTTAQKVLNKLLVRNVASWNALITGFSEAGCGKDVLLCFEQMQQEGIPKDAVTFVCCLKACGGLGAKMKGQEIHAEIVKQGEEIDILVSNTLIDMYAKCGLLLTAKYVFDKLPAQDLISWNVLMAGYIEYGCCKEVLHLSKAMQHGGFNLDAVSFLCILKACSIIRDICNGRKIHAFIVRKGVETGHSIGNCLVDMYVKCGSLVTAQEVFNKLPVKDVVSWTALIVGYMECGHSEEALNCLKQMQHEGISSNAPSLICGLKACGILRDIGECRLIHDEIIRKGLEREPIVENTLVDTYGKCGSIAHAQAVFDTISVKEVVLWTVLISGYLDHGQSEKALDCYSQMEDEGICYDAVTLICGLKACGNIGATDKGRKIHTDIAQFGFLERDAFVGSALVDMYTRCCLLAEAQEMFDKLPVREVVSWTSLITGYADHGCAKEALHCFEQMQSEGICPDSSTLVCGLRACGLTRQIDKGREIYLEAVMKGLEKELLIGSALVDMYGKCGSLVEAQDVFARSPVRDTIWWNTLIAGYAEHGQGNKALDLYDQMEEKGSSHDAATLICCLKACGGVKAKCKGQEIHTEAVKKGLESEILVGNILVDTYAKCGLLIEGQEVFENLSVQEAVSWTALIAGYAEHGYGEEALDCFKQMRQKGIFSDSVTLACCLTACSSIGATVKGRQIHSEILKRGLELELQVGNMLVDMYGKCSSVAEAQEVFDNLPVRDVVSWNALIAAHSQSGNSKNVFVSFDRMLTEAIKPDLVTFVSVLNTCSHAGLVDKGQMHFKTMNSEYCLVPTLEHYTCMVDLFGRAGHIDRALSIIRKMPCHPDIVIWHTVLGACRKWGDVELGRHAFEQATLLDVKDMAAYMCMHNIYADAAMQEEADKVEAMRIMNRAWRKPRNGKWRNFLGT